MAILQSICTAVLTINGVRFAIGLTAVVMAGSVLGPVRWFHQDAIRIPMLILATVGATGSGGVVVDQAFAEPARGPMAATRNEHQGKESTRAAIYPRVSHAFPGGN